MKKKLLFLIALICVFASMLVVCASAKTVYLEEIPEELKVPNDKFTHFVVFEEEDYFVGGSTINGINIDVMKEHMASANIDASKIGTEYLVRYNFPAYMNNGATLVGKVDIEAFKRTELFSGKCGYIQIAGTVKSVTDFNEYGGQVRCVDFGENSQVTVIPLCFAGSASNLKLLKNFPRELDKISQQAFNKCYSLTGELYLNATTIESEAFNNAIANLTKLTFGPKTSSIARQSICVRLSEVPDAYRPADGKVSITELVFECDVSKVTFATQGNNTGSFFFTGTSRDEYSNLERIVLAHPDNERAHSDGMVFNDFTADGINILFDTTPENDFVTVYHSFTGAEKISYENGLLESGISAKACVNCGKASDGEKVAPIFEFLGYSYKMSATNGGIACGYFINRSALDAYQKSTGAEIDLGFVIFNVDSDSAKNATVIFDKDKLAISEKSMQIEITDTRYSVLNAKISGFNSASADTSLAISLYLTEKTTLEEEITYKTSFVQGVSTKSGKNVAKGVYKRADGEIAYVSYNSIIAE